jgi:hypothetical protein
MKHTSKLLWSTALAALLGLVACSGGSSNDNSGLQGSAKPGSVPDNAGTTVAGFMAYLAGLDPNDEKSEPLLIKDSFAVPPDESSDSQPHT